MIIKKARCKCISPFFILLYSINEEPIYKYLMLANGSNRCLYSRFSCISNHTENTFFDFKPTIYTSQTPRLLASKPITIMNTPDKPASNAFATSTSAPTSANSKICKKNYRPFNEVENVLACAGTFSKSRKPIVITPNKLAIPV